MNPKRSSWDEYFINLAIAASTRSTCLRRQVGAVLVQDKQVISTGYNGPPKGIPHCTAFTGTETDCIRLGNKIPSGDRPDLCYAVHAEANAIALAAKHGVKVNKSTLYCTNKPCGSCLKVIINSGIEKIVYKEDYTDIIAERLFKHTVIEIVQLI